VYPGYRWLMLLEVAHTDSHRPYQCLLAILRYPYQGSICPGGDALSAAFSNTVHSLLRDVARP
jgi:hypothetical protein